MAIGQKNTEYNLSKNGNKSNSDNYQQLQWDSHAQTRKTERNININPSRLTVGYVKKLPYYTNSGCYHYCDVKEGIIYYVRDNKLVTLIKAHPIAMLRKICMIRGLHFDSICRDHIFGNCRRGCNCKYQHIDM